jgi:NAD(P)-dependent dehydrogenase (short-subunit alcohol dehydrogenase family)
MDDFTGRVAVVTGGASGIGFATAKALAAEGCRLVLADIQQEALDAATAEISALGADVIGVRTDVTKREALEHLADVCWERFGGAHILFNNAGIAVAGPVAETSHDDWRWCIDVDLWGPIHGVEVFVPRMIAQAEGGHVLSTASFAGLVPNVGLGAYCVAKYGVVALMEVLHKELRPHGIGASVLCPMRVPTQIDASGRNRQDAYGGPGAQDYPQMDEGDLAGSVVAVEEVAALVVSGIREGRLYLLTHPESLEFVRRRFERIARSLES